MNKLTTTEEIDKLEATLASLKLKREEEKKEKKGGNEFVGKPSYGEEEYYIVEQDAYGKWRELEVGVASPLNSANDSPSWKTAAIAKNMAEALQTWTEWNACTGVSKLNSNTQFILDNLLGASSTHSIIDGGGWLSPCFNTEEHAQESVELIGRERIMKMRNQFHFKFD